jgi:DNA-binding MarR family transcriptional regulator
MYVLILRMAARDVVALAREDYLKAWRWRREVEKALKAAELTLTQWLVLDATSALSAETDDAVSQADVAERTELDKMTVSQVMKTLAERSLVERGPDSTRHAYRIVLAPRGEQTLRRANRAADAATRRFTRSERSV